MQDNIRKLNLRIHQLQLEKWEAQEGKEKGDGRTAELKRDLLASRQEKREVEDKLNALRIELAGAKREIERLKVGLETRFCWARTDGNRSKLQPSMPRQRNPTRCFPRKLPSRMR